MLNMLKKQSTSSKPSSKDGDPCMRYRMLPPRAIDRKRNQSKDQCAFQEEKVDAEHTKTKDPSSVSNIFPLKQRGFGNSTWRRQGLVSRVNKQARMPDRVAITIFDVNLRLSLVSN